MRVAELRALKAEGAARVLIGELLVVGKELSDWVTTRTLAPFGPDFPVVVRPEDLALIAARVTPQGWNAISRGLAAAQQLRRYVLNHAETDSLHRKLISRHIVYMVARDRDAVRRASLALAQVASVGRVEPGVTMRPGHRLPGDPAQGSQVGNPDRSRLKVA